MKPINNIQFIAAALITTIGCALLLLSGSMGVKGTDLFFATRSKKE